MGNLGDSLKKHAERHGIARQIEAVDVIEKATEEIAKFVPKEDFEVVSFNRGALKIKVKSSVVASEIRSNVSRSDYLTNKKVTIKYLF